MDPQSLAVARDLALILLIVETAVLALPLLIIPFLALRYLRRVKAPIRPNLRKVRQATRRMEQTTKIVMGIAVQPLLWATAAAAGLGRGLEYLARRR